MTEQFTFGGEIVWKPSREQIEHANLTAFMKQHGIKDFNELMKRSTEDVAWFTDAVLKFLDIQFYEPYSQVVDLSQGIQFPAWCVGGRMNIVLNCVDKYQSSPNSGRLAMVFEGEEGITKSLTYEMLYKEVNKTANALRSLGLGKGDAVGLFMPMTPEIVIALLAIAKIGGVVLPLFSGYGAGAIVSRMTDANAKALFAADGAFRRGKAVEMKSIADEAAEQIGSLQHMIVLRRTGQAIQMKAERDHWWHELVDGQSDVCETERTSAEDPLMIIYTSGTTGRPKGAVHTHCGFPIKAAQDMAFGTDVHGAFRAERSDVIYWMTDMGWMMGPWQVFGSLLLGATMFLYDGAPDFPAPNRLWELAEKHRINQMGVSPTLIRSLIPQGDGHFEKHDLSSLKCFASTGEPWNPDPWMWLFEKVGGGRIPIINYSGGTEISGGIVMGNLLLPLKPCAFSAACPGMDADVVDENGRSIRNAVGELVVKAPWIGMTRGFWNDRQRYLDTYWSRWENVWVHGDFAAIDGDGLWYILGRSDDTIKIAGKRLGPAEVESILVRHGSVVEAAAIGVPHEVKGSELVLFAVTSPGVVGGDALRQELYEMVVAEMGKPLAPKAILFVSDLPKTRNAKVMRRVIRSAYLGLELGDTSSLVNPQAVEEIRRAK
ncbi:MAG TPA: AMP-binding protein [Anaerolineales bacterium]|nr:AMP-binding protein [Anaerolineales bacterium]HMX74011.1 AMP-binding protein [Anaerolineales bacterium]HMZ43143.1 AMP-binding protein [Anaerolineales bacterium]HNC89562.1 AMP-binding protein [Anaerolineales bacterium]HNH04675.1 AMP-binding protein [Anaerolineales bacterium]